MNYNNGCTGCLIAFGAGAVLFIVIAVVVASIYSSIPTNQIVQRNNMTTPSVTEGEGVLENVVNVGDTITGKDWEITIEHIEFSQRVDPPVRGYYSQYYQVDNSDDIYLYCILNCKNLSTLTMGAEKAATVKVKYNNNYTYSSFSAVPDDTIGFTYTMITGIKPFMSQKIYYLAEMPKFIADETDTPVEVQIRIENQTYHCIVREAAVVDEVDESAETAETESAGEN